MGASAKASRSRDRSAWLSKGDTLTDAPFSIGDKKEAAAAVASPEKKEEEGVKDKDWSFLQVPNLSFVEPRC